MHRFHLNEFNKTIVVILERIPIPCIPFPVISVSLSLGNTLGSRCGLETFKYFPNISSDLNSAKGIEDMDIDRSERSSKTTIPFKTEHHKNKI